MIGCRGNDTGFSTNQRNAFAKLGTWRVKIRFSVIFPTGEGSSGGAKTWPADTVTHYLDIAVKLLLLLLAHECSLLIIRLPNGPTGTCRLCGT